MRVSMNGAVGACWLHDAMIPRPFGRLPSESKTKRPGKWFSSRSNRCAMGLVYMALLQLDGIKNDAKFFDILWPAMTRLDMLQHVYTFCGFGFKKNFNKSVIKDSWMQMSCCFTYRMDFNWVRNVVQISVQIFKKGKPTQIAWWRCLDSLYKRSLKHNKINEIFKIF